MSVALAIKKEMKQSSGKTIQKDITKYLHGKAGVTSGCNLLTKGWMRISSSKKDHGLIS